MVQAGAFSRRENAETSARQLSGRVIPQSRGLTTLYRVVLGPWPDQAAADRARADVARRGFADAAVVRADF